jgi:hypothetical protein
MQPYLNTAQRLRWVVLMILAVVWGVGLASAWIEYTTTYESAATVWVIRASPALSVTDPDDPNIALIQTAASQQAEVLEQLLETRSFLVDVIERTSLRAVLEAAPDQREFIDDIRKHFDVEVLGTSLLRVSFAGKDPNTPPELVNAALTVRAERLSESRVASAAALSTLYQRELQFAEKQALDAQRALDQFNAEHRPPLSTADEHVQAQLRLGLDFSLVRLGDLRGRLERSSLAPALLEVSGIEFQIVDEPRIENVPSGGERSAMLIAIVSFVAGTGLATLLILTGTLLASRLGRPTHAGGSSPTRVRGAEHASLTTVPGTADAAGGASTARR